MSAAPDPRPILVVNAGSSSLKLRLTESGGNRLAQVDIGPADDPAPAIEQILAGYGEPAAFGHRVVHGGSELTEPALADAALIERLERAAEIAPLHDPPAIAAIHRCRELWPGIPSVACFDTGFHRTIPDEAAVFAVPASWSERMPARRFGFHGLSHSWNARRSSELLSAEGMDGHGLRLISAHLGSGSSLAAIRDGRSLDTTMGFTPLDGLIMATRPGSLDPGLVLWAQRRLGIDAEEAERQLEREAGLAGLTGGSGDMRELLAAADDGDPRARLAFAAHAHRLAAQSAAMAATLGGVDAISFTGGIGERSAIVRAEAGRRLAFLGVEIDPVRNDQATTGIGDHLISAETSDVAVLVVEAREDAEIARQVARVIGRE